MRNLIVSGFLFLAALSVGAKQRPEPRNAQIVRIRSGVEVYGIVHWGLNTYTDCEWGFGDENPADLNPTKFDADQIVESCKAGGLQGLIVVAKHHDGFCLWPTKTTGHNISKSPFRGGKGNYVKEMEEACRRHGLKFGVYVSPWDRNNALYGTEKYVIDVFQRQIRELLSGDYGEIFEMWVDGANGGDGYYGGAREKRKIPGGYYRYDTETFAMVRQLQPNVCIFNESDLADFRFGGNEQGVVDPNSRSTGGHYDGIWENYRQWANTGLVDGTTFHPIEADFPLRPGWFFHAKERGKTKNAAYLMRCYLTTVGNAATLNLGIAPNKDGVLDNEDVKALKSFGDLQKVFFSHEAKDGEPFNVVVMREDVSRGELVDDWKMLADGKEVCSGKSIGIKRIRTLATPCAAKMVELKATSATGIVPKVKFIRYFVDPKLLGVVLAATTESGETDTAKWMTGKGEENHRGFVGGSEKESKRMERKVVDDRICQIRGLVSYWDFGEDMPPYRAKGPCDAALSVGDSNGPTSVEGGPLSGRALHFDGTNYLTIPYSKTGGLNVRTNQVTVVAWIKWIRGQIGFVGGMWNEHQAGGKRQYGLFVDLPHYNGGNRVCGHISKNGGPTPYFPYSLDYSASAQEVPDGKWCCVAFTYDGKNIKSYLDGRFEERAPERIDHTAGFIPDKPDGLVHSKNPYYYPDGIGDNGSDFTVGAVCLAKGMGNFFKGDIGGLAVYNRALSDDELLQLAKLCR